MRMTDRERALMSVFIKEDSKQRKKEADKIRQSSNKAKRRK